MCHMLKCNWLLGIRRWGHFCQVMMCPDGIGCTGDPCTLWMFVGMFSWSNCLDEQPVPWRQTSQAVPYYLRAYMQPLICCVVSVPLTHSTTAVCRLVSPLSLDEFGWSKVCATLYNNIMFVCSALVAIATFVAIKFISKVWVTTLRRATSQGH